MDIGTGYSKKLAVVSNEILPLLAGLSIDRGWLYFLVRSSSENDFFIVMTELGPSGHVINIDIGITAKEDFEIHRIFSEFLFKPVVAGPTHIFNHGNI